MYCFLDCVGAQERRKENATILMKLKKSLVCVALHCDKQTKKEATFFLLKANIDSAKKQFILLSRNWDTSPVLSHSLT